MVALAAGALAVVIRNANADGRRPWRTVISDACGTMALGYAIYFGADHFIGSNHASFAFAVLAASMGWEWVKRKFGAWADKRG